MPAAKKAKGAEKSGLLNNAIWNTLRGKEKFYAEEALEIGRTNENPRFKFLARVIMTIVGENPGAQIKGLYDEDRATKTEIRMEEKQASGMSHTKEDAWIKDFWVRIGGYQSSVRGLENEVLQERFTLLSAVVGAYSNGLLCYDSHKVFSEYNAKVERLVPTGRVAKKVKDKRKQFEPLPAGAGALV